MPGIDRSTIVGESAEVLNVFSCNICQDVFNQPMVSPCRSCRYTACICKECIDQWLSGHNTGPKDLKPLTKGQLTEDINRLRTENENLKISISYLMSSEMAFKEENKRELDLKTDQLKTLKEKVIQMEREKAIKDSLNQNNCRTIVALNKRIEDLQNYLESSENDKSETEVALPGEMASLQTLPNVGSLDKYVIRSYLRCDLTVKDIGKKRYQDSSVRIVAQKWVKQGLEELAKHLPKNTVIEVHDIERKVVEPMSAELSLKVLQRMARNESYNTDGTSFEISDYGLGIDLSVVLAIKDLSRQCVIVGTDWTTHYGGFKNYPQTQQKERVFVCDSSGLKFQNQYNTGRLVIVGKNLPKGLLDDFIYEKVVGEPKPTYEEVANDRTHRFVAYGHKNFLDTKAYIKFVVNDVLTAGLALDKCSTEELNFKFLKSHKYGNGFCRAKLTQKLVKLFAEGVAQGLELLLPRQTKIKAIELPFYQINGRIKEVCLRYNIEVKFSKEDALKRTHPRYMTATTNSSNPHSGFGNRMGFGHNDSAIAENLEGRAIKFLPSINQAISELFLD